MRRRIDSAPKKPMTMMLREAPVNMARSWPAALFAFSISPAPTYWDTRESPATPNPALSDMRRNIMGQLIDGAATASGPTLPSQNVSVRL